MCICVIALRTLRTPIRTLRALRKAGNCALGSTSQDRGRCGWNAENTSWNFKTITSFHFLPFPRNISHSRTTRCPFPFQCNFREKWESQLGIPMWQMNSSSQHLLHGESISPTQECRVVCNTNIALKVIDQMSPEFNRFQGLSKHS